MTDSDLIRKFARENYIEPARRRNSDQVRIIAGEVHRALRFTNRVPLVCSALSSRAFLEENRLSLLSREGPPSGTSTTVVFTYGLEGTPAEGKQTPLRDWFYRLRGAGKEVFAALGGGEQFIRAEREQWRGPRDGKRP